jgi:asparagine synthase (glutamine-hydrolysing)
MNGLFGWFAAPHDAERAARKQEQARLALDAIADGAIWAGLKGAFVGASDALAASIHRSGDVLAAVWGSPEFTGDGANRPANPAERLAQAFARQGAACLDTLRGAWSVVLFDASNASGLIALDRMGRSTLYYADGPQGLGFATTATLLRLMLDGPAEIDPQGIADYLYCHMIPGPGTLYRGIRRVEAGELLEFRGGRVSARRYWTPRFDEQRPARFEEARDEFHRLVEQAVGRAAAGGAAGCFLSGGTDSSTVAGMLGKVTEAPARTFSIGFSAQGYDEMEYARIAVRRFEAQHTEYYVTPEDVVAAIPAIATAYDQPFGNASAVPTLHCARLAQREGIDTLLAGDGGDELFGGNQRYADQWIFSLYGKVPGLVRALLLEPVAGLPGGAKVMPIRKLRSYIAQASTPMPQRLQTYNAFERFGGREILEPDFAAAVRLDHALGLMRETYEAAHAGSLINRMLALDWKFTLADNDLRKVGTMCELAGVAVRYPFLDEDVVDFSMRLPPDYKLKGRQLRWFFKQALADFLPREIIEKKKHGFGLPFGVWARDHAGLRELAYDSLTKFKTRGIIRPAFIDRLMQGHQNEHAAYYGAEIWVVMMLEQWFQQHVDRPGAAIAPLSVSARAVAAPAAQRALA